MDQQIITGAERVATAADEPRMTFSELQGLLREAREVARAERPIYLVSPDAVTVQPTGHVPPGWVPSVAEVDGVAPWAPLRRRVPQGPTWGVRLVYASLAVFLAGAGAAAATDGNPGAIAAIAAGIAGTAVGGRRALAEENEHEARS